MGDTNVKCINTAYAKDETIVNDDVFLENLSQTANHILNIMWDRNVPMTVAQLTEAVNAENGTQWGRKEVQQFVNILVKRDYVTTKRKGLQVFYYAVGREEVPEDL